VCIADTDSKSELLGILVDQLAKSPRVTDADALREAIFVRESLMSTGIGLGVGIPHVRLDSVTDVAMAVAVSRQDIADYESLDGEPVRMAFMIAANSNQHAEYLRLLGALSQQLKVPSFRERLLACETPEALYDALTSIPALMGGGIAAS
jgi:PTS system nitrogen regulatory IIA component